MLPTLQVTIWSDPRERPQDFVEATFLHSDLSFGTAAHGGFQDCSFTIPVSGWNSVRWYRSYVGHHVKILDHLGRTVYEGRISDTESTSDGVKVNALGYISHATEIISGIAYPISTPTTASQIISDTVELSSVWNKDKSMIQPTITDITPQDFTVDKKLQDAIEQAVKYGNDDILYPRPMYFAIWEGRRAYFYEEPLHLGETNWRVYMKDFASSSGLSLSRSRSGVYNKIQAIFDDPYVSGRFTAWAEDLDSQKLFGVRMATINAGSCVEEIATLVRDLALKSYAYPQQNSTFGISSRVYTAGGVADYPYMVRAGQVIQVMDYDPSASNMMLGSTGADATRAFILSTSYNASSNELSLELGTRNSSLDLLMARLGMSASLR